MKKIFVLIIFSFAFVFLMAQNQRFVYEYYFKMDSLNRHLVNKEIMNLDITKDGSQFYSALLLSRDSLFHAEFEKGRATNSMTIDMRKVKKSKVNFRVSKIYPSYESTFHTILNAENVALKEVSKMNWEILPEISVIKGFKVQKATTNFGGRKWIAWFTNEVQIQDGPYKFCNLPGLILNVEDEKSDHVFKFIGNHKIIETKELSDIKRTQIFVTKEKFNQLWNEYKNDPAKNIKMIHNRSDMADTLFSDANGNPLTKQDLIRNKEEGMKKTLKHFNNFIEV